MLKEQKLCDSWSYSIPESQRNYSILNSESAITDLWKDIDLQRSFPLNHQPKETIKYTSLQQSY